MSKHTPGPWKVGGKYLHRTVLLNAKGESIASGGNNRAVLGEELDASLCLASAAPDLLAYAKCEEARASGEDIAETVLKQHGWIPGECTSHEFMDRMRRAAIAKAEGK